MRRKLLFSVVMLLVLLALFEVGLRLDGMRYGRPFWDDHLATPNRLIYIRHPFLSTTLRPAQTMHADVGTVTVNENGLRGAPLPIEAPSGERRVAVFGGSVVFGTGAKDADTFPVRMERVLNETGEDPWHVINGGVPGFTSAESLIHLMLKVSDYRPDYVILYQAYNDLKMISDEFQSDYSHMKGVPEERGLVYKLFRKFRTYRWLRKKLMVHTRIQTVLQQTGGLKGASADSRQTFRRNVTHFVALAGGLEARPVLSTFAMPLSEEVLTARTDIRNSVAAFIPSLTLDGLRTALDEYNGIIREVAAEHGVPLLDGAALLASDGDNFIDHCHLSPQGAERLGRAFGELVLRNAGVSPDEPQLEPLSER